MGNEDQFQELDALSFYHDPEAQELIGKLDLHLKDGMHFQERDHQYLQFQFIKRNYNSLAQYYRKYHKLILSYGGEGLDRYYYLEFNGSDRGSIDGDHRYFLRAEFVIIGFMIYKIIFIDGNVELSSVSRLQSIILSDYEELMEDIYRLLAKIRKANPTTYNNEKVRDVVLDTLKEFKKLGWVIMEEDFFDIMPSFSRLQKVYGDHINNLEDILKSQR